MEGNHDKSGFRRKRSDLVGQISHDFDIRLDLLGKMSVHINSFGHAK